MAMIDFGKVSSATTASKVLTKRLLISTSLTSIAIIAATLMTWRYHGFPTLGTDDANIFFGYAANLVDGHGFVYNACGERVEGFTSL